MNIVVSHQRATALGLHWVAKRVNMIMHILPFFIKFSSFEMDIGIWRFFYVFEKTVLLV